MARQPVKSSNILSAGWDPAQQRFELEFRGGRVYHYHDVSPAMVDKFFAADSCGKFFHSTFKGAHQPCCGDCEPGPREASGPFAPGRGNDE